MAQPKNIIGHCFALGLLFACASRADADNGDWLTDADVTAVLERGGPGVFYAWSPHMPLSVVGLAEIRLAGQRLGIAVVPVLSSHANVAYARDRTASLELPDNAFRRGRSVKLEERNLNVHAPAILVFDAGRFVSPVIPGFRSAADYEALIQRFLASARRQAGQFRIRSQVAVRLWRSPSAMPPACETRSRHCPAVML